MHPLAKIILPAATVLLLALAGPAVAQETSASAASPAASAATAATSAAPAAAASTEAAASPAPAASIAAPVIDNREAVEDIDRWDTRNGFWIWPLGLVITCGLILLAYKLTPEPVDKVTAAVVTTASGTTHEEPLT